MLDIDRFRAAFFEECGELLAELDRRACELATLGQSANTFDSAFRAVHSIKGAAGMFGFDRLVAFAQLLEEALEQARAGKIEAGAEFADAVLHAVDVLSDLVASEHSGEEVSKNFEAASRLELTRLARGRLRQLPVAARTSAKGSAGGEAKSATYRIHYRPAPATFRRGLDPLSIARNLAALGRLQTVCDCSRLPDFADLDPALCHLEWTFELETSDGEKAVRDALAFAADECRVEIENKLPPAPPLDVASPQKPEKLTATSLRVDVQRVNRLADLAGEIGVAEALLMQRLDPAMVDADPQLYRALTQLTQLSRALQDAVLAIRAQPIHAVFLKMQRVAREASLHLGKKANLEFTGEDTEIDKTIIDEISDPLMHIVRNAIDHGIETAEERRAAGKPEVGLIKLSAAQRGERIVIEVRDDGRGVDRSAVRHRAVALGLIEDDADLDEFGVENLVFRAGLSTARSVSEISGRGVGMDVVSRNVHRLGGRATIRSEPGAGATTTISLPLTLAVVDAMLVRAASEYYLIPLASVLECTAATRAEIANAEQSGVDRKICGGETRFIDLASRFGLGRDSADATERIQILHCELQSGAVAGFVVDDICGQRQAVVKDIREAVGVVPGLAGATILGDGRIAFILDIDVVAAGVAAPAQTQETAA